MKRKITSSILALVMTFNSLITTAYADDTQPNTTVIKEEIADSEVAIISDDAPTIASLSIKATLNGETTDVSFDKPFYPEISSYTIDLLSQTESIMVDATPTNSNHTIEISSYYHTVEGNVVTLSNDTWATIYITVTDKDTGISSSYRVYISKSNFVETDGSVAGYSIDSSGLAVANQLDSPLLNYISTHDSSYNVDFVDGGTSEKDLEVRFTDIDSDLNECSLFLSKGASLGYIKADVGATVNNISSISLQGSPFTYASATTPVTLKLKTDIVSTTNKIYFYNTSDSSKKYVGTIENGYATVTFNSGSAYGNYIISAIDQIDAPSLPDVDAPTLESLSITAELAVPDPSKFYTSIDFGEFNSQITSYSANIYAQTTDLIFDVQATDINDKIEISFTGDIPTSDNKLSLAVPTDIVNVSIKIIDNENVNNYTIYTVNLTNPSRSFVEEDGTVLNASSYGTTIDESGIAVAMNMDIPTLTYDAYVDSYFKLPSVELEKELIVSNYDNSISMIIPENKTPVNSWISFTSYNNSINDSDDCIILSFWSTSDEYFLTDESTVTFKLNTKFDGDGEVYIYQASTWSTNYQEKIIGTLENGVITFEIDSIPSTKLLHIIKPDEESPKLTDLSIDGVVFDKIFDPEVKEYLTTVSSQTETLTINATADPNVTITTTTRLIGDNDMPDTTTVNADGSVTLCPYADRTIITLTLNDTDNVTNEYKLVIDKGYYASENGDVYIGSSYSATIIEEPAFNVILNMDKPTLNIRSNVADWLYRYGLVYIPANINLTKGLELNFIDNINNVLLYSITIPAGKTIYTDNEDNYADINVRNKNDETISFSPSNYREDLLIDGTPVALKVKTDLEDGDIWLKTSGLDEIEATIEDGYIYTQLTKCGYYSIYPNDGVTNPFETPDIPTIVENLSTNEVVYKLNETDVEKLSVVATANGDLTYEWYSNTENYTWGGTLVSSDSTFTPVTDIVGTTYYYCIVTNTLNNSTQKIYSNIAKTTVITTTPVNSDGSISTTDADIYIDENSLLEALSTNSEITITCSDIKNIILPEINADKEFTVTIIDQANNLTYSWTIPAGENVMSGDLNLALVTVPSATCVDPDSSYFDPDPTSAEVIQFAHNGDLSEVGLTLSIQTTITKEGGVWLYKLDDNNQADFNTEMTGSVSAGMLTTTIKNCSNWLISTKNLNGGIITPTLPNNSSSGSYGYGTTTSTNSSVSGSYSSSGYNSTGAGYSYSGNISVNGTYINELRGILSGEMVNLDKITDINGQTILGWYYDAEFTQPVISTSKFVFTSDIISNGLYAKVSDLYNESSNSNSNSNSNNFVENIESNKTESYINTTVPSTSVKMLSKLF